MNEGSACVFAHYDVHGIVDDYVIYSLTQLSQIVDRVIFVSTSKLLIDDVKKLEALGVEVITRPNVGYDFYSYKVGIEHIGDVQLERLILCNDSVYGPVSDIEYFDEVMSDKDGDFWGITESFDFSHHLQSYFLVFKRSILASRVFKNFWRSLAILEHKKDIVRNYEVGLSHLLVANGFKFYSAFPLEDKGNLRRVWQAKGEFYRSFKRRWHEVDFWVGVITLLTGRLDVGVNHSHLDWERLIVGFGSPYIKVELLRDNPKNVEHLEAIFDVIRSNGDYPVDLIVNHLERVGVPQGHDDNCSAGEGT